jgi:hypothetical protein
MGAGEPPGESAPPPEILERLPDEMREKLPDELVVELLGGAKTEEEIFGRGGLFGQLTKRLVERALEVELTGHLGYEPHQEPPGGTGNTRNGKGEPKTLVTEHGPVQIRAPRDRDGSFEPRIVRKRQRRFEGFDEKILALYSRGMSTRDIEAHLRELYGVSVGRDLISRVTDAVLEDVKAWQPRLREARIHARDKLRGARSGSELTTARMAEGQLRRRRRPLPPGTEQLFQRRSEPE